MRSSSASNTAGSVYSDPCTRSRSMRSPQLTCAMRQMVYHPATLCLDRVSATEGIEMSPATVDLATIDLMDPEWFRDGPPHELFARMRAEAPVRWNEVPGYEAGGFWSVTRHADVSAISRDTATFSSHRAGIFLDPDQVVPLDLTRNLLLYKDPPEHTKYRKILQTAFVPHTVRQLEDDVRARVTRVIDAVIERGQCDFVSDIAVPIPLGVLTQLMGIPDADIPRLYAWT